MEPLAHQRWQFFSLQDSHQGVGQLARVRPERLGRRRGERFQQGYGLFSALRSLLRPTGPQPVHDLSQLRANVAPGLGQRPGRRREQLL